MQFLLKSINHTLMSNTYLFVIKDNYIPGWVVIFLLNYNFTVQNVFYNMSWNEHDTLYFMLFIPCILLYSITFYNMSWNEHDTLYFMLFIPCILCCLYRAYCYTL